MDSHDRLASLLMRWQEAFSQGRDVPADELCRDCPELADALRHLIAMQKKLGSVAGLAEAPTGETPSQLENLKTPSLPFGSLPDDTPWDELHPVLVGLLTRHKPGEANLLAGRYQVLQLLGQGGMGVVFLAHDTMAHRRVALKFMKPGGPKARERFLREARSAAALEHDHVVRTYHVDEIDGIPYIVMPFLQGESLEARLHRSKEEPLPVAEVLQIGREAAAALASAHARGLVHRDVKPANLWLERNIESAGHRTLVLDFGLAKSLDGEPITQTGSVMGTPGYMAPEQADGQPVDGRADLFSLGCVLYRLAAGRPAFQGKTLAALLRAVAEHDPPPPHQVNPEVPGPLSDLILRLLAKDPAQRPTSAREVYDLFGGMRSAGTPTTEITTIAVPVVRRRKWTLYWSATGLFIFLVVGGMVWLLNRSDSEQNGDDGEPRAVPAVKEVRDPSSSLSNQGKLLWSKGDYAGAEPLLREALAMRRRLYPGGHPDLASSLSGLGGLLSAKGDFARAEPLLRETLDMQQRLFTQQAVLASEAEALNLVDSLLATRDALLSVTRHLPEDHDAYDLLWRGRSALTRILEQRHRDLLASHNSATRDLGEELLRVRQRLSNVLLSPVKDAEKHVEEVRTLTEVKEGLEKIIADKLLLETASLGPALPSFGRLSGLLPTEAVFLDFYRYTDIEQDLSRPGKIGERHTLRYATFVITRGRMAARVELGEAAPLEKAWAAWHNAITKGVPAQKERRAAATLADLVWEPIREKLPPGVRTVYLAPDGALTQVPWAALPGSKPDTVLLEEYAFATVPHGPFLLDHLGRLKGARPQGGTLLAVGGVDYHKPPPLAVGGAPGKRLVWSPIPGTKIELERIDALAKKHANLEVHKLSATTATTTRVLAELPKARYAHLATHGFFADAQFRSAFQVNPEQFNHLNLDRRGGARSPLVLSGLVFAGANRTGDEAEEDRGILTAEAIVGLRLDKLELAVLSGCQTGLGEVGGGEGVYGLQRAFHLAGCQNVIASLWQVEDQSTVALMMLFYTNLWEKKLDPLQALREAQLDLYRHPDRVQSIRSRSSDYSSSPIREKQRPELAAPMRREKPNLQGKDFEAVPLPPGPPPRARTAQWAAFTFSGVAALPKK